MGLGGGSSGFSLYCSRFNVVMFCLQLYRKMVKRCVAGGCSNNSSICSMHMIKHRRKWIAFVQSTRKNFECSDTSVLCAVHFDIGCFTNYHEWRNGYQKNLKIAEDATPSIKKPSVEQNYLLLKSHHLHERGI